MRQWVLTAPVEVRRVMALRAEALSACSRIFVEEVARFRKACAGIASAETGSVYAAKCALLVLPSKAAGIEAQVNSARARAGDLRRHARDLRITAQELRTIVQEMNENGRSPSVSVQPL